VFRTLENLWISAERDISDAGEYDMMQSCAMYIAGGCDMSPEEEAASARQMQEYVESGQAARDADESERRRKFSPEEEDDFPF
jgi:hypothetical protein